MSNQVWILIAVVVIVAIVIAYQRSRQSQVRQTRDLDGAQELGRDSPPARKYGASAKTTGSLACQQRIGTGSKLACSGTGISKSSDAPRGPMPPSSRPHVRPGAILRGTRNSAGREVRVPRCVPPRWHARSNRCSTDAQPPGR